MCFTGMERSRDGLRAKRLRDRNDSIMLGLVCVCEAPLQEQWERIWTEGEGGQGKVVKRARFLGGRK